MAPINRRHTVLPRIFFLKEMGILGVEEKVRGQLSAPHLRHFGNLKQRHKADGRSRGS
jgi:hypothetical protein